MTLEVDYPIVLWTDGWKYRTEATMVFPLSERFAMAPVIAHKEFHLAERRLVIYEGFLWNGASGPTVDTKDSMGPSLVHDCLCYACRQGLLDWTIWRDDIDAEFHRLLLAYGMNRLRAGAWYLAVRLFGKPYAIQQDERPVRFCAPVMERGQ